MSGVVACVAYASGKPVANVELDDISEVVQIPGQFVWIGLQEPDPALMKKVQEEFSLHELAVEDTLRAHQRPKLEQYGQTIFVVLRTVELNAERDELDFGETHLFVGPQFVVSVRHGASKPYVEVRSRCEATPQHLRKGPGFVLYALMDFIVDQYFPVVDSLEEELESLEEEIFKGEFNRETTERIYHLKRELMELKRAVSPLVDVCNRLMRFDLDLIPEDTRPYFRDVYDHVIRINEMVDSLRELLASALEANLSMISVNQNEVTKKLASWAAIIAVPTMIAGIYGMNFRNMPELTWSFGYPLVMAFSAACCSGLYVYFKRSGWL